MKHVGKRILALVLTLAIFLSMSAVSLAAEPAVVSLSNADTVAAGSQTTFTVSIGNNPGIAGFTLSWKVVDSNGDDATAYFTHTGNWLTATGILKDPDGETLGDTFTRNGANLNWNASENISGDGALCTMKLAVDASIVNGQYTISLNTVGGEPTNFCDTDGAVPVTFQPYTFEVTGGIDPATLTPTITTQPQSADYTYGDTPAALSVAASVQTEGTLSYQWYKGGIPITGATGTSYTPMLSAFGSASYTCKVTNTYNGRAFSTTSTAAVITYNKATIGQLKLTPETAVYTGKKIHVTASIEGLTRYSDYDLTVNSLSGTAVGTYTVTATGKGNYQGTSTATWSITPAEITIDGSQTMTIYTNGKQFDLSGAFTATTVDGTTPTITYTTADTGLINLTSDGKVTAITTGKATVTATVRAANHNTATVPIDVTIQAKADVSGQITFSAKASIPYDGAAHKLSELVNAATYGGSSENITYKLNGADATLDTAITDAGTYTVTAYYEDDTNAGSESVDVTINPKAVAAPSAKTGLVYNTSEQTGVAEGEGYTLTGNTGTDADSYTATATLAKNYIWSDGSTGDKSIDWEIAQQPITVDLSNIKWDYTAPFTYDTTEKTVSITSGVPDTVNAAQSGTWSATNAGSYTATVTFTAKDDNYVVTEASKTASLNWKIEKAEVTVPTAATGLKYDGQPKTGVASGALYGVEDGTATDAGRYTAKVTLNDPANYKWATDDFTGSIPWSIAQADAQKLTAEKSLRYSNTAPQTLTAADIALADAKNITIKSVSTASNSILNANAALSDGAVSYQLKNSLTADNNGDTAKITVTFSSKNYADSTLELTVKVIKKIDVSGDVAFAEDSVTRTYTGLEQKLETATYNGAASDKISYSYSATPKDVGTYTVTATYEDDDNIGTATATLKIDPAELTITGATAADKTYDGSLAATVSDVTFSGLVNGETLGDSDYTVTNAAFANANAGTGKTVTFTVTLAADGTAKNYVLTGATGSTKAAINPASITVTVADIAAVTYDGQPKTPVLTVKTGETTLTAGTDYTVAYTNNTNAGTASATVKAVSGGNYTFADVPKEFEINKANHADVTAEATVFSSKVVTGAQTKSVDLSAQIAGIAGAAYGTPTKGEGSMITGASMSGKQLTITYTPSAAGTKQTVTVPVTADNYNDFDVVVTVTAIDKNDVSAQITFADKTVIWNGAAQSLDAATYGGSSANITYKVGDGAFGAMPSFTDAGTYTVTARYEDARYLGYATATLTITNKLDLSVKATATTDEELLKILVNNGLYTVTGVTNATGKNETTATVKGTKKLTAYLSTDPGQQDAAHQWIGLLIGTTLNGSAAPADSLYYSADGVTFSKLDEIEFTDAAVHGGTGNEFVLWMKTDVDKTLTRYIATLADGSDAVKLTITFTPYKSSSSSSSSSISYSISIADKTPDGGKISVSPKSAKKGDIVTITVTPDEGYVLDELIVTNKNDNELKLKDKGNGKFTFTMPASKVEIEATFKEEAPAITTNNTIVLTIGSPVATVYGQTVVNDVAPIARNNRTLLPIRFIAEALGAQVEWNADLQKVTIRKADLLIELYLGQTTAYVNGQPVVLDVAAFAENNRTYLPLRFIAENLGATVLWDQPTQSVTIIG